MYVSIYIYMTMLMDWIEDLGQEYFTISQSSIFDPDYLINLGPFICLLGF